MVARAGRLAVLACAAVALAGCGDGAPAPPATAKAAGDVQPVGDPTGGSVVQVADCDDWNAGTRAERVATVEALRGQLTPQHSTTAASPLGDERAYEILEKACSPDFAGSLRLYKLYARAQGFAPLSE